MWQSPFKEKSIGISIAHCTVLIFSELYIIVSMSNFAIKGRKPEHAILLQDPALSGIPCDVTFEIAEEDSTLAEGRLVKGRLRLTSIF